MGCLTPGRAQGLSWEQKLKCKLPTGPASHWARNTISQLLRVTEDLGEQTTCREGFKSHSQVAIDPSEPLLPHVQNGDNSYLTGSLGKLYEAVVFNLG